MTPITVMLGITLTLLFVGDVAGSRILLLPAPNKSHSKLFSITARGLKDAGHDPWILVPETHKFLAEGQNVSFLAYPVGEEEGPNLVNDDALKMSLNSEVLEDLTLASNEICEAIHTNDQLMDSLEQKHFDLAIVDGHDIVRCLYSIPYRLGVRYITFTDRPDPWMAGIPALPSVESYPGFGPVVDKDSSMWQRIQSLVTYVTIWRATPPSQSDESIVTRYCPTKPKATLQELFEKSEMWLVNLETICLDFPRVHGSHYQFVAGAGLETTKSLPKEWEDFAKGSRVGIILIDFGSTLSTIPEEVLEPMLEAFAQVEFRIVMRHAGPVPDRVPLNVKLAPWLPRNDLLGHAKARAFITDGGANAQMEALYHAVPMITIPMFGDQFYNAKRVEAKGFGVTLDRHTFTAEVLVEAIQDVAKEREYRDNIRRCAERFRSMPSPQDTVNYWVEHIARFGGDHLRPVSIDIPVWKLFMLDIFLLIIVVILTLYTWFLFACVQIYKFVSRQV